MNTACKLGLIILSLCALGCVASEKLQILENDMVEKWGACDLFGSSIEKEIGQFELCKLIELNYSYIKNYAGSKELFSKYVKKHKDKPHTLGYLISLRDYKTAISKWYLYKRKINDPEIEEGL